MVIIKGAIFLIFMARFERPKGNRGDDRKERFGRSPRSGSSSGGRSDDRGERFARAPREGSSGRSSRGFGSERKSEMTKVQCAACKEQCEVPFKPVANKPVYCRSCFMKDAQSGTNLDVLNEKLDKIMRHLKIK